MRKILTGVLTIIYLFVVDSLIYLQLEKLVKKAKRRFDEFRTV